mgnify:FL=1
MAAEGQDIDLDSVIDRLLEGASPPFSSILWAPEFPGLARRQHAHTCTRYEYERVNGGPGH